MTGDICIDERLNELLKMLDDALPGRIASVFLQGSYSDGSQVRGSDVDLEILPHNKLTPAEFQQAQRIVRQPRFQSLDVDWIDPASLSEGISPQLRNARLLRGTDPRGLFPDISIDAWTLDRMKTSYWRLAKLFRRRTPLEMPLGYPDERDEFFRYLTARNATGGGDLSTRDLVRAVGWAATALIAARARKIVSRKRDVVATYSRAIADEWTEYARRLHDLCRDAWNYEIPKAATDRQELRELCRQTLGFENAFMIEFRYYVLERLRAGNDRETEGLRWLFAQLPLADAEIQAML